MGCWRLKVMAEGVGFEPTVTFLPRSISSRVPSTGLSHPSFFGIRADDKIAGTIRSPFFGAAPHLSPTLASLPQQAKTSPAPPGGVCY